MFQVLGLCAADDLYSFFDLLFPEKLLSNLLRLEYRRCSAPHNPHVPDVHSGFSPPRAILSLVFRRSRLLYNNF